MTARAGLRRPTNLAPGSIDIGGHVRTYSLAPGPRPEAPLLLVLHGGGGGGPGMAALTGLAERGPGAGFAAVFPDGVGRVWNDQRGAARLARREGIDDVAFLQALVARLVSDGVARGDAVYAVGMSNGSLMAEHIARHDRFPLAGIALVAGPATVTSRAEAPHPPRATDVVMFHGTADPIVPYAGGPITVLGGVAQARAGPRPLANRRARRFGGGEPGREGRGVVAPVDAVASDWAATDGCLPIPVMEPLAVAPGQLPVTRLTWNPAGRIEAPDRSGASPSPRPAPAHPRAPSVVLYRIEGGGHTWPGGAQYLPGRIVGAVASHLDATAIVLARFSS